MYLFIIDSESILCQLIFDQIGQQFLDEIFTLKIEHSLEQQVKYRLVRVILETSGEYRRQYETYHSLLTSFIELIFHRRELDNVSNRMDIFTVERKFVRYLK